MTTYNESLRALNDAAYAALRAAIKEGCTEDQRRSLAQITTQTDKMVDGT
jgi:hypothetical protein